MNKLYLLLFTGLFFSCQLNAQYDHTDIYLGQTGVGLLNNLNLNYKPGNLPDYSTARFRMFKYVYAIDDTVTCLYTGLKRHLAPASSDPIADMLDNNSSISINSEHIYPQSKTTADAGKSDLHHLVPTSSDANNGRSSNPFGEIAVSNIDKWYYNGQIFTSAPASNILPLSSKLQNNAMFEPRDDYKGNVARAVFYYYTMYKSNADAEDPNFFNTQKARLCQWHLQDPVDSLEWDRTSRIAIYQQGRVNPFVHDCTLPERCGYCSNICIPPTAITREEDMGLEIYNNYPNPFQEKTTISYQLNREQIVHLEVYNNLGQRIEILDSGAQSIGLHQYTFDAINLSNGMYFYRLTLESKGKVATFSKPIILSK
jgi:hypothetical protein